MIPRSIPPVMIKAPEKRTTISISISIERCFTRRFRHFQKSTSKGIDKSRFHFEIFRSASDGNDQRRLLKNDRTIDSQLEDDFTPLHHRRTSNFFSRVAEVSGPMRTNSARFDLLSGTKREDERPSNDRTPRFTVDHAVGLRADPFARLNARE